MQSRCEMMKTQRVCAGVRTSVRLRGKVSKTRESTIAPGAVRQTPRYLLAVIAAIAAIVFATERFVLADHPADTGISSPARAPSLARHTGPAPAPAAPVETSSAGSSSAEPFVLTGTMAATDPLAGSAFIGRSEQTVGLQKANTEIAPGVWLREVYATRVVIERNGVREVLLVTSSHPGGNAPRSTQTPAAPPPASGMADSVRGASTAADGELRGIHVFPGRNRGAFAQLGLHPGDLITEIDGVPVSGQAGTDVMSLLQPGADSTVTVFRAGRLQQITVHAPNAADPSVLNSR